MFAANYHPRVSGLVKSGAGRSQQQQQQQQQPQSWLDSFSCNQIVSAPSDPNDLTSASCFAALDNARAIDDIMLGSFLEDDFDQHLLDTGANDHSIAQTSARSSFSITSNAPPHETVYGANGQGSRTIYRGSSAVGADLAASSDGRGDSLKPSLLDWPLDLAGSSCPPGFQDQQKRPRLCPVGMPSHPNAEERLSRIMAAASEAGFESFDEVATFYYTQTLDSTSRLGRLQRVSRKRGLRDLLAALQASAGAWPPSEARGLREQTVCIAETVYVDELRALLTDMDVNFSSNGNCTIDGEKLPELWSLITRLATAASTAAHRDALVRLLSPLLQQLDRDRVSVAGHSID